MFGIKKLKEKINSLTIENARLSLELSKYKEVDRLLHKIVTDRMDLSEIPLITQAQRSKVAGQAIDLLNNELLSKILNHSRHKIIMSLVKESRDYNEVVQKRANLLFTEVCILEELRRLSTIDQESETEIDDDLDFLS